MKRNSRTSGPRISTNKVSMSLAELQRREAAMKTARAETRETRNRLELLGVPRQEIERLDREHTIKADVPLTRAVRRHGSSCAISRGARSSKPAEALHCRGSFECVGRRQRAGEGRGASSRRIRRSMMVAVRLSPRDRSTERSPTSGMCSIQQRERCAVRVTALNPERLLKPEMFATRPGLCGPRPRMR